MRARAPLEGAGYPPERLRSLLPLMRGLSSDSRRVGPGLGFAAYPGESGDGRDWIPDALARGASALLWEPEGFAAPHDWPVPHLAVPGLKDQASRIAAQVYGDPSAHLQVIGVTGTNGKTSCTHWIAQALTTVGRRCALVGTLGTGLPGAVLPTGFTTPGPVELQQQLAELRDAGASAVAMEVSSHGLAQGRVDGVHFDLALFTNLTRDHLDYHGTMAEYGRAKASLFRAVGLRRALVNVDDGFGAALCAELTAAGLPAGGFSCDPARASDASLLRACDPQFSRSGIAFRLETPRGAIALTTRLLGAFNLSNLLGVIACLLESGLALEQLPPLVSALEAPPGRLQRVGATGGPQVVIDYAHTPDALEQVLRALRGSLDGGRLMCVFGCGGDRDPGKRPLMGRTAEALADLVILTSDNPRSEDPEAILAAIASGMNQAPYLSEPDRETAIRAALAQAQPGDLVLIAGKGHETTQEVAGRKIPFSDLEVARRGLAEAGASA